MNRLVIAGIYILLLGIELTSSYVEGQVTRATSGINSESYQGVRRRESSHFYQDPFDFSINLEMLYPPGTRVKTLHRSLAAEMISSEVGPLSGAINPVDGKAAVELEEGRVRLISIEPGRTDISQTRPRRSKAEGVEPAIATIAFSGDGKQIVTGDRGNIARLLDAATLTVLQTFQLDAAIESARFSPDGKLVATCDRTGLIKIWETDRIGEPTVLTTHPDDALKQRENAETKLLEAENELRKAERNLVQAEKRPDPDLAVQAAETQLKIAERTKAQAERNRNYVQTLEAGVSALAFNFDGSLLVSGDKRGYVAIHKRTDSNYALLRCFESHKGEVRTLQFRPPHARNFATSGEDGRVKLWHSGGRILLELKDQKGSVDAIAFTADGLRLLTAGRDRKILSYFLHGKRAELTRTLETDFPVVALAMHQDGRSYLVCGRPDGLTKLDLVPPDATFGLILADHNVDRRYREASTTLDSPRSVPALAAR